MRRLPLLVLAVGLVLAATGCTSLQGTGDKGYVTGDGAIRTIPPAERGDTISLSGKDLEGKPISLDSLRGKPTVVTVWGRGAPRAARTRRTWWRHTSGSATG